MKKRLLFILPVLLIFNLLKAQLPSGSYSDYFREGSFLLLEENFDMALKNFTEAYNKDSSSANINFNMGYCYLNSSTEKGKAERYLAKAITNVSKAYTQDNPAEKSAPPLAFFYYARALHINYKFDEALKQYTYFEDTYAKDKATRKEVEYYKMQCQYAKTLVSAPINVEVKNLGDSINSEYPEYSPALSADERTIIYTTCRPTTTGGEKEPNGLYNEDIVIAYKDDNGNWTKPVSISPYINSSGMEASINLTPDGQTLIVYKDAGEGGGGNIYYSTWDGKDWSSLQAFGSDINSKYHESHACLSADGNTLYFVSERPGGFGGRDIYRCVKLPNGKWSLAQNMGGVINTEYDEDGVFIHPDGVTMIFASRGHQSMGGFDIFFSTMDEDKKFSEPMNMGYPINTPDDDIFFVTSPDGKRGYFSSAKDGGYGEKDIYQMFIPDAKEKPLALFKGHIIPADGENLPEDLMIVVTDKETGEIVGTYKPKQNGTYSTILPPNKNYNFSYQSNGQEFYNEDLYVSNDISYQEIKKEINLEPVKLLGHVAVKTKTVSLNTIVLNNPKDKQAVPNANITLTEKGGSDTNYTVDEKGKKEGTPLANDKQYTIVAEANGKKSNVLSFNTVGVKGSKVINQILYMESKPAKTFDLPLNLTVVNKQRKPLEGAKVTVTGNDGSRFEGTTDSKGRITGIDLLPEVNYDVIAEKDGETSDKLLITTLNTKANKAYNKTITIKGGSAVVSNNHGNGNDNNGNNAQHAACGKPVYYKYNFAYDKNSTDENQQSWNNLIESLVTMTKSCSPTVKILSSASQVPTHSFKNNHELAESRADKMEEEIKAAVAAKGGDAGKLIFEKHAAVRGPQYMGDWDTGREKYKAFQYVKVIAK
ncbi:MAG: PD40 domain-containing protein [Bacteroidetes bacterium]|nr:PD40 domain-containing protein [Bacteroidota bacterium]